MQTMSLGQWATVKLALLEKYHAAVMFGSKAEQDAAWKAYKDARVVLVEVQS